MRSSSGSAARSVTTKRLPVPEPSLRATTRPPWRRTSWRTMNRPSPRPAAGALHVAAGAVEALEDLAQLARARCRCRGPRSRRRRGRRPSPPRARGSPPARPSTSTAFSSRLRNTTASSARLPRTARARARIELHRVARQIVARAQLLDALVRAGSPSSTRLRGSARRVPSARAAASTCSTVCSRRSTSSLHAPDERAALLGRGIVALERVEVQAQRRERRLHLVGDGVEEGLLALVQPHLAHEPGARARRAPRGRSTKKSEPRISISQWTRREALVIGRGSSSTRICQPTASASTRIASPIPSASGIPTERRTIEASCRDEGSAGSPRSRSEPEASGVHRTRAAPCGSGILAGSARRSRARPRSRESCRASTLVRA